MNRKTLLEKLAFAPREEIAKIVPDGDRFLPSGTPTVTPSDIAEFLNLSACAHKAFFKYSRIDRLSGMLQSRRLLLSRLSEMNDLDEYIHTKDADRIYVASLSFGSLESMEMWKLYGGDEKESVRYGFPGDSVNALLGQRKPVFEVIEKNGNPTTESGNEIPAQEIECWSFHDMAYKYGAALMWNGKTIGAGRCPDLKNIWKLDSLATFVKRYGWESENESRLVIKLRHNHAGWRRIAVDFGAAIDGMSILIGPAYSKAARVFRAYAESGLPIPSRRIKESSYTVDL